ncbi:hypothetical protein V0288_07640 [Pannus brasiliensis CCIBt3594]|uniref:Uncharacterized protein n=1 Tax=Pannus brasiliensis CCIBt3594 TaxID=1427578 RepID=A0AAW9QVJ2_9CHRO
MITVDDAKISALEFLTGEWELSEIDRAWLEVLDARLLNNGRWYVVEIGVKDLPDKWVLQIYEEGNCDPCYTFVSPYKDGDISAGLESLPESLSIALQEERNGHI